MSLKPFRPQTPTRRHAVMPDFSEITKSTPERSLIEHQRSMAGRNNQGRITIRHRGGGHKQHYRLIDFKRNKDDIAAKVSAIEYDPNRSARLALLFYKDGEKRYILATLNMKVGDTLLSGTKAEPIEGNNLPLSMIPVSLSVHNIELTPGRGAQLVRCAGMAAEIMARADGFVHVKLPSGEVRILNEKCRATVGQVGNPDHQNIVMGKAGRKRWLGIRPTVRGVVMNPVDHPHGGGEGRSSGGGHPRTPWGEFTKGKKTRDKRKTSARFILERRK